MTRARTIAAGLLMTTVALALAACGSSGGSSAKGSSTSSTSKASGPSGTTGTTPPPTVEGRTAWQDVTAEWKERVPAPISKSPQQVAEDLAAAWRGGDTGEVGEISVVAVTGGEPAKVVLKETGGPDLAVIETDVEITLEPGDEGWAVSKARRQSSCRKAPASASATSCPAV